MNEGDDSPTRVIFLFDVDNTLLDNDRVAADLQRHLASEVGAEGAQEYWGIFEQLRTELGYADYLGALQRYRAKHPQRSSRILLVRFRFFSQLSFRRASFSARCELKMIEHVTTLGSWHDKLRIWPPRKNWGSRYHYFLVRQGPYAFDRLILILASYPPADISIGRIWGSC